MKIFYRISDNGYKKDKPAYINNENCLRNFTSFFPEQDITIIADNISILTLDMIKKYILNDNQIKKVNIGNGAGTFNIALDLALSYNDDEIIYFVENDYIHRINSAIVLSEGFDIGSHYVTLYDHPDKYVNAKNGGNPFVDNGGEVTKVFLSKSCHWKLTNSTTMTFAAKVKTLKKDYDIIKKYTFGTHPNDFQMFMELRKIGRSLVSPIPSYSTHGETLFLAPIINWNS